MAVVGQTRPLSPGVRAPNLRTPLFIFGVALALVAFLVMFAFGILFVGRSAPTGAVPVVVAKQTIDARTPITPDMLALTSLPAAAVPPNTYLHIADLKGSSALVTINKGQAISSNLVSAVPDALVTLPVYLPIPDGLTAVTLPTNEQQGVAGYINVGDYIDISAQVNTNEFTPVRPRNVTVTVFTNVYVVKVGPAPSIQGQTKAQGVTSSITVLMSPCDFNYMNWLLTNGTLKYTLTSYKNYPKNLPTADDSCTAAATTTPVGPSAVDSRWHFTNG